MQILLFAILFVLAIVVVMAASLYLAPERATRFFVDLERSRAGLTRKQVDLPDGLRIHLAKALMPFMHEKVRH